MTPEEKARQEIDAQLSACGWIVQDFKAVDFSAGRGVALREVPLTTGPCDYLLLVDRKALGVVEAKKQGTTLSTVADQSGRYGSSLSAFLVAGLTGPPPFLYESTGAETFFRDERDPAPCSRRVFTFHRPETLAEWAADQDTRFADLVALVRFALEQQPVPEPFAESVAARFNEWLMDKAKAGVTFQPEQLAWLNLIRDHIATSLSIEPDDFNFAPVNQRGGLGKAHQLFGEQLPKLLDELDDVLAA